MDVGLLTLTVLSLATAAGLGLMLWRSGQRERQRELARIAALSLAMDAPHRAGTGDNRAISWPDNGSPLAVGSVLNPGAVGIGTRPLITFAVGAAMAVTLVVGGTIEAHRQGSLAPVAPARQPLELVSMHHVRDTSGLTVSGVLHDPSDSAVSQSLLAVVTGYDASGTLVVTQQGPVEQSSAERGELRFVVTLPGDVALARYRVGFRAGRELVRHVDRRAIVASLDGIVR